MEMLESLCRERKTTVIVATHDERIVEMSDVTYRICDGSIVC
jgi:ABC-type lipoprotein export system ATPase subunit